MVSQTTATGTVTQLIPAVMTPPMAVTLTGALVTEIRESIVIVGRDIEGMGVAIWYPLLMNGLLVELRPVS